MNNLYHFIVAGVLSYILLVYFFPWLIYILSVVVLRISELVEYSEDKKDDWTSCLIIRLFYLCVFGMAWGLMLLFSIPMFVLMYIENFGGFVDKAILEVDE